MEPFLTELMVQWKEPFKKQLNEETGNAGDDKCQEG